MSKFIFNKSQSASNKSKSRKVNKAVEAGRKHKAHTLSLGAICRYIDKLSKQGLLESEGFKPNAIKSIQENGAFKTIRPLLNEKQEKKLLDPKTNIFGLTGLIYTANRLDKKPSKK